MKRIIIPIMLVAALLGCARANEGGSTTSTAQPSTSASSEKATEESTTNVAKTSVIADAMDVKNYSTDKVIWGPGRADNHAQPADPVALQQRFGPLGAKFISSADNEICLTFDEGYENGYTPAILDTLKEKNVKAIFFVTYDFARDNMDLIKRMIDEGHTVGNHTYRHYTMDEVSEEVATEEIVFLDSFIKENFNYKMKLFRFPKGEFSERTLALAKELGYTSVFWSYAYADWDTQNPPDPQEALKSILDHTHSGEIMLLHAVSQTNAEILGEAIDGARNQGYTFTDQL